jgi:hypothetical protein
MKTRTDYQSGIILNAVIAVLLVFQLVGCGGGAASGGEAGSTQTSSGGSAASGGGASAQAGSVVLSWVAPSARSDGTALSMGEIAGYRLYYGTSAGDYPNRIEIADGAATSVDVNEIPVGTYYFVMTTYDMDGRESSYSDEISKTVN